MEIQDISAKVVKTEKKHERHLKISFGFNISSENCLRGSASFHGPRRGFQGQRRIEENRGESREDPPGESRKMRSERLRIERQTPRIEENRANPPQAPPGPPRTPQDPPGRPRGQEMAQVCQKHYLKENFTHIGRKQRISKKKQETMRIYANFSFFSKFRGNLSAKPAEATFACETGKLMDSPSNVSQHQGLLHMGLDTRTAALT